MAASALADKIDTIVATPHHLNGSFDNFKHDIVIQVNELNSQLQVRHIPLTVIPRSRNKNLW
ncbi:hypothetical protein [Halobacillus sp. BBL2006]|uniref:hypothetical protein n=1 Tax=Halobacillus sp. BBL2006 TaxID=1543706 RepID=UPI000ADE9632